MVGSYNGDSYSLNHRTTYLTTTAMLAATYTVLTMVSSWFFGQFTHGMEALVLRSLFFVIVVSRINRFGYVTLFGIITGVLLELGIPGPIHFYLFPSQSAYGLVFDYLIFYHKTNINLGTRRLLLSSAVASASMSAVALTVFTLVGFFPYSILLLIWVIGILRDVILGIVGAYLGILTTQRIFHNES